MNNYATGLLITRAANASVTEETSFLKEDVTGILINYYYKMHHT